MAVRRKTKVKKPPRSMRKAINEKCKDCIYDDQVSGTWRAQVEACDIMGCPLWNVRPRTTATAAKEAKQHGQTSEITSAPPEGNGDAA